MHYHRLSVIAVASLLWPFATSLSPRWDDIHVKHAWDAVPANWECLGHPPVGTTIDLYVALKPQHENALIDTLYEVSEPRHRKHVLSTAPLRTHLLTCGAVTPLQIRRTPVQGAGRRTCCAAPTHARACQLLV